MVRSWIQKMNSIYQRKQHYFYRQSAHCAEVIKCEVNIDLKVLLQGAQRDGVTTL